MLIDIGWQTKKGKMSL